MSALTTLLDRASDPLAAPVDVDFGVDTGPLAELRTVLGTRNGFFCFNAGIHLFRAGDTGHGYDLGHWNAPDTWKDTYGGLADGPLWFAQDLLGHQFGALPDGVCVLDPETGDVDPVSGSLEEWAAWLLSDPDGNGRYAMATQWQDAFGPLAVTERLVRLRPLVLGGENAVENIVVRDAVTCMQVRGPVAQQIADLPDGAQVEFRIT
jgi:hypothetical protein